MSFQVNRVLRHCYQLPALAHSLEAPAQPFARALGGSTGLNFRRGFAEEGKKPLSQPKQAKQEPLAAKQEPSPAEPSPSTPPLDGQGLSSPGEAETSALPNLLASAATEDAKNTYLGAQGVLDISEVLENTFKVLKSRATPLVVENPPQSVSLFRMLSDSFKAYISSRFITNTIETSHNDEEFLAGAGDAFQTVFEMVHAKDWEGLEPMMSPRALKGFKQTHEEHAKHGLRLNFLPATGVEPQHAIFAIMHQSFVARAGESVEDEEGWEEDGPAATPASPGIATAALDPPAPNFDVSKLLSQFRMPDPTKYYQIATVAFKARLIAEVKREEDGQLVLKSTDNRRQTWMFARGPLPRDIPRRELDLRWKLLALL